MQMKCRVILYRYSYKQLFKDRDLIGIIYRACTDLLKYESATHVALWLQTDTIDIETAHGWCGTYTRELPYLRQRCFKQVYTMPQQIGHTVLYNSVSVSRKRVNPLDLWRHYKGKPPKGRTCLTWAQFLMGVSKEKRAHTIAEFEELLTELGGVPRYGIY